MCETDPTVRRDVEQVTDQITSDGGYSAVDRVLKALTDERCRYICYYLTENEPADIEECARAVTARETGRPPADVPEGKYQDIKTMLYHQYLPRLVDLKIIEYDPRSGVIRFQHPPSHFEEALQLVRKIETE